MSGLKKMFGILLLPLQRARALRADDRGQVVLLAGMIAFLIAIMGLVTLDTAKGIHNRITAQNAVDSAADAAALWQARGCNLLQHLNNLHYDTNVAVYILEANALGACAAAAILKAFVLTYAAGEAMCIPCCLAPFMDRGQELFVEALMKMQSVIKDLFPVLAFAYANVSAYGSGADPFPEVVSQYASGLLNQIGIDVPGLGEIVGSVGSALDWVPLYAMPLDPDSLSLQVEEKECGELEAPWHFPEYIAAPMATVGRVACAECFQYDLPDDWGWKDSYYYGNPGFMTWLAGKKEQGELLGMGDLTWFNAESRTYQQMRDTHSKTLYKGDIRTGDASAALKIPAFMGIASSQVEGEPVISKGDANASPRLITVHLPPDTDPKETTAYLIFH
ncbi:MAG TPA: hypothetical protein DCZ95_02815 [Verrucomicrobia bacterium]|nr:MAG: hypothetical protein A2X46_14880 [Lentisphaerae bacterium GWF2_57_35]HBA83004.1 hypothetical protein [Verrucomicrobiota bacterium]